MPKYLLLKHYRGAPEPHHPLPPMDQWAPEDVEAHMAFLRHVSELLEEQGEYVDAQALTPARTWVRYGGPDAAPVTTCYLDVDGRRLPAHGDVRREFTGLVKRAGFHLGGNGHGNGGNGHGNGNGGNGQAQGNGHSHGAQSSTDTPARR